MKRGTPGHPKTIALAELLGIDRWGAVGILESLWHFTGQYARRGDIGRHRDVAIARGIDWKGDPSKLVNALADAGWLDRCACHRLTVHHWSSHAEQAVKRTKEVEEQGFVACGDQPLETTSEMPETNSTDTGTGHKEQGTGQTATATADDPKRERVTVGHGLIASVAELANLDPTEVLAKASEFRGGRYVRLDTMSPARLDQTIVTLRAWERRLRGAPEPGPPSRAAPSSKAAARADNLRAAMLGGLKGDGTVSMEGVNAGRGVGEGLGRADRSLPAARGSE